MKILAPIVIFAFNRPDVFKLLIESLKANAEFSESEVYVYIDGARDNKTGEKERVEVVQEIAHSLTSCKPGLPKPENVHIQASEKNKGLAASIIKGVSDVIEKYGKAIVFEEDRKSVV